VTSTLSSATWAQESIVIVRGDEDYPPHEMMIGDKLVGFHIDLTRAVAATLKIEVNYVSVHWKRAINMVRQGKVDAISYIGKTPERDKFAIFHDDNVLSSTNFAFLILKENQIKFPYSGEIEPFLNDKRVLAQSGFDYGRNLKLKNFNSMEVRTLKQLVIMLQRRRSDVGITAVGEFKTAYKGTDIIEQFSILHPPFHTMNSYLAFSKARQHEQLAERFGKGMQRFKKTSGYTSIQRRYKSE